MQKDQFVLNLFGATGDLAARKLYPSIYRLYKNEQISKQFALIGSGRTSWTNEEFREHVYESIKENITDPNHAQEFLSHFYYIIHDVTKIEDYINLKTLNETLAEKYQTNGNQLFYISLAPSLFPIITSNLKEQHVIAPDGYTKLLIEKPFGNDLESAVELQEKLTQNFEEEQIYRIDHYLGKEIVTGIKRLRFMNIFSLMWNKNFIDNVQISLNEDLGVEDRGSYYDESGATKDMVQNHIMQLLSLVAMREPVSLDPEVIRLGKQEVIRSIRPYQTKEEFTQNVVRGQYGRDKNQLVPAYREEQDVDPNSNTETYFAARVYLNMPEWTGVPFFIQSGKRMDGKYGAINIIFKNDNLAILPNRLQINLAPNFSYQFFINNKLLGYSDLVESVPMTFEYDQLAVDATPDDYERLIYHAIQGHLDQFVSWEEVKHAWKFIDHIHAWWDELPSPEFPNYESFSTEPRDSVELLNRYGTRWFF